MEKSRYENPGQLEDKRKKRKTKTIKSIKPHSPNEIEVFDLTLEKVRKNYKTL